MTTLGQKLREIRHHKGFKLNEVAEGADLSISFISLIERDRASISVENLNKLAAFYNVRLFQIFQDLEEEDAHVVTNDMIEGTGASMSNTKTNFFLLSSEDNLSFSAYFAQIPPSAYEGEINLKKGEAFIEVKEGELNILLPNKKPLTLSVGDTAHLTSYKGTIIKNANQDLPAKIIMVVSSTAIIFDKSGDPFHIYEISS